MLQIYFMVSLFFTLAIIVVLWQYKSDRSWLLPAEIMKYISKLFQPLVLLPKDAVIKNKDAASKSQRLMMENGIIKPALGTGLFSYLPLGIRSIEKLTAIVNAKMEEIGAQKLSLPILIADELWVKTGRFQNAGPELMKIRDRRDKCFILGPTHEESITELIASLSPISHRQLPLKLYQIDKKYRDEMRPRYGLIRSREFLMKDLYTFDKDKKESIKTYDLVNKAYDQIFSSIGVDFMKVEGCTGPIGGVVSHEYHYLNSIGENILIECSSCNYRVTKELLVNSKRNDEENELKCPKCGNGSLSNSLGIEVGHTFLLGTKYSDPLDAFSVGSNLLHMGCYGLGISRIVSAAVEVLSTETELRWPALLAPYTVCIIGPKEGSREEDAAGNLVEEIYSALGNFCPSLTNDIIIDDRSHLTIGKKMMFAKRAGYPFIIVVGKKACNEIPEYEFFNLNNNDILILNKEGLIQKMIEVMNELKKKSNVNYMENFSISNDELNENSLK